MVQPLSLYLPCSYLPYSICISKQRFSFRMFHNYSQTHPCSFFNHNVLNSNSYLWISTFIHINNSLDDMNSYLVTYILAFSFIVKFASSFPQYIYIYLNSTRSDQFSFIQVILFQPMNPLYIHFSLYVMSVSTCHYVVYSRS